VIVTEAQAKQLWCPYVRSETYGVAGTALHSANRDFHGDPSPGATCLGSRCMLWRWAGYKNVGKANDEAHGCCALANHAIPSAAIKREMDGSS
jgi:hypothetical protein